MNDGRIVARKVTALRRCRRLLAATRPYGDDQGAPRTCRGPYTIPNVWIDAYCVYTNRTPSTAMRGFGVTMATSRWRSRWTRSRGSIGMDPLEFRFINAYRDGDMKAHRKIVEGAALIETMQAAAKLVGQSCRSRTIPDDVVRARRR